MALLWLSGISVASLSYATGYLHYFQDGLFGLLSRRPDIAPHLGRGSDIGVLTCPDQASLRRAMRSDAKGREMTNTIEYKDGESGQRTAQSQARAPNAAPSIRNNGINPWTTEMIRQISATA